jgi:hypothetical protein
MSKERLGSVLPLSAAFEWDAMVLMATRALILWADGSSTER